MKNKPIKFIFTINIKEGHSVEEYIAAWKRGSAIIQASEGAGGTVLYRKIDEPGTLIAIATWESKELRDVAMKKLDAAPPDIQAVLHRHKEYGATEILGSFEEIDRVDPQ
ncbi:MAG: antibiotic biosynthesis monooxygenase [Parcubacteria group bacterium]|nr:antibiotic biosynthesis monooxygenase [Parcubacteria group bacterium]